MRTNNYSLQDLSKLKELSYFRKRTLVQQTCNLRKSVNNYVLESKKFLVILYLTAVFKMGRLDLDKLYFLIQFNENQRKSAENALIQYPQLKHILCYRFKEHSYTNMYSEILKSYVEPTRKITIGKSIVAPHPLTIATREYNHHKRLYILYITFYFYIIIVYLHF